MLAFDRILLSLRRSALFEMGNTRVIAAVYGPREVIPLDPLLLLVCFRVHVIGHAHGMFEEMLLTGEFHLLV